MTPGVGRLKLTGSKSLVGQVFGNPELSGVIGRLTDRKIRCGLEERLIEYAVQVIGKGTAWADGPVDSQNRVYALDTRQLSVDYAQLIQAVVANVVGLNQEVITKLPLQTEVPSLGIGIGILALKLIVS
jgi:hypothetical protein